jgi:tRNA-2-methylthio-N6-dimethylallyladenosine synthase
MKYCLLHLGCQMNQSDAERVRTVIEALGYELTDAEAEADLLGIVACSVRQRAIDKAYARIHMWNSWKERRSLLTFVTGCILPADREKFLKLFDLVFDITEIPQLPDMIRQYGIVTPVEMNNVIPADSLHDAAKGFWRIRPRYSSRFEAYVPIQNGCDKFCTFCAVPYTRGQEVSRPSGEILQEVAGLVDQGYKSITLLGQNVNSYGLDRKGREITFPDLLRGIGELGSSPDRDFRVYFTSPHPRDMTEEVVRVIVRYPCLAKQIHLPLQSGDDRILIRMNRNYMVDQYRETVSMIRSILPRATLFTDIIVGFSGETEAEFENTRKAMREFQYNMAYVAMYSPRPGAASYRWPDDVPHEEKNRRLHVLSEELARTSGAYNRTMIGKEYRVLVEGPDRKQGFLSAKTEGRIIVRFPSADGSLIGQFTTVKVTAAASLSVEGELVGAAHIHDVRTGVSPRSPSVSSTPSRIPATTSKT